MRTLYFECFSGISGDMTIGALLDLGADKQMLLKAIDSLMIDGYKLKISETQKCGITATKFDVILESESHGYHKHDNYEEHSHDHHDHHHDHNHEHHHRGLNEITAIINSADITENAKKIALKTFDVLAEAEAKVHGLEKAQVHFHEVGAIDSIVDIVGIAVCIDSLKIDSFSCSKIYEGQGHVFCQHGRVPVPAPATLELAKKHGLMLKITEVQGELVTPTGAALLCALKPKFGEFPSGNLLGVGIGAGTKDFEHANILRLYLIDDSNMQEEEYSDKIVLFETNIDDSNGEQLGYAIEKLLENGALDVYYTPIFMKKSRPAYTLSVMCDKALEKNIISTIFEHTTAIGLKRQIIERIKMKRRFETVATMYGDVVLKHCSYKDVEKTYLEYESVKKCAVEHNISLKEVETAVNIILG